MTDDVCIFCFERGADDLYEGLPAHRFCCVDYETGKVP